MKLNESGTIRSGLALTIALMLAVSVLAVGAAAVVDDETGTQIGTSETVTVNNSSSTVVVDLASDDTHSEDTELTAYVYNSSGEEVANETTHINETDTNATVELDVEDDAADLEDEEDWTVDVYGAGSTDAISVESVEVEESVSWFAPIFGDDGLSTTMMAVIGLVVVGGAWYGRSEGWF